MLKRFLSKQAFTLLEILVVIIIVGVLASVAMPTLFRNIERSRMAEAITTIGIIKRHIDACAIMRNNPPLIYTGCDTWDAIGMSDPSQTAAGNSGKLFNYFITDGGAGGGVLITATRTTVITGGSAAGSINFDYQSTGTLLKSGSLDYAGYQ